MKLQNLIHILMGIVCIGLLPRAHAVVPAPDGGYPGGNTAEGQNALFSLTSGGFNTAVGFVSLRSDTTGSFNTAVGAGTLLANTAEQNTATGAGALLSNTIGEANTANGAFALLSNTSGNNNTAIGDFVLFNNSVGNFNTANGVSALGSNTTGSGNTAIGSFALSINTEGSTNTAIGSGALSSNTTGNGNIAVGASAGTGVTTADSAICIGTPGSNQTNSCYIGNIFAQEVALDGVAVLVDSLGKLGVQISSRRFKEEIQPMDKASEVILALKPVTFHYKSDAKNTPCFGLIAEDVAKVNPHLVVRDKNGEILTVRYDQVNAMLLNEFLKEHRKNEEQEATIAQLKKDLQANAAQHQKQIEALTEGLQKVSAQLAAASLSGGGLEASKFTTGRIRRGGAAPQVVNNP
jgi:trimeric autotransporter adhesin